MDVKYSKFYQLGNGGDLIFERDLDQLSELLERPHPEFFGAQLNDQGGEDLQWLIVASLRGKIEPPTAEGIQFTLRVNNWLDGLARAMQEALSRLCGQSINQIKGTHFEFFPRRDANGQPLEAPYQPELKTQLDHLSFMMYDRQQELDNCRDYCNHKVCHHQDEGPDHRPASKGSQVQPPSARQEVVHYCPSSPPHLISGGDHPRERHAVGGKGECRRGSSWRPLLLSQ